MNEVQRQACESLELAVVDLDCASIFKTLHSFTNVEEKLNVLQEASPFHRLVQVIVQDETKNNQSAAQIVYALSLHGGDINLTNENGDIALLCYIQQCTDIKDEVVVAFLRCGTDPCCKNTAGMDVLEYVLQHMSPTEHSKSITHRVLEYMPGIWRAVASDDVCTVRRLINQWCHIRIVEDGVSVLQLAFNKGTENIIRVVSGIGPSMDLAHAVLAGDLVLVDQLLNAKCKFNINLKNMSEGGATPVFYAMCQNNWPLVDMLLQHGARLDISMQLQDQVEIPLYFVALAHRPSIDVNILRHTIPTQPVHIDQLFYKGRNVLFHALEHGVDVDLFEDILRLCSPSVLTHRIPVVTDWCTDTSDRSKQNILCLHGYQLLLPLTTAGEVEDTDSCDFYRQFLQLYSLYENFKVELCEAVDVGDVLRVREMLYDQSWAQRGLDVCHADSRCCGDGQPLLHKAVLRQNGPVVTEIAQYITSTWHRKLDTFRDQYFRTCLHYVYGMEEGKEMITTLEEFGMSEYIMDKDGRSPLAFRDRRGLKEMNKLLLYHLHQDLSQPEPDPWSVILPLPMTGYLKKCMHDHLAHKNHSKHKHRKDHVHGHSHAKGDVAIYSLPGNRSTPGVEAQRGPGYQNFPQQYQRKMSQGSSSSENASFDGPPTTQHNPKGQRQAKTQSRQQKTHNQANIQKASKQNIGRKSRSFEHAGDQIPENPTHQVKSSKTKSKRTERHLKAMTGNGSPERNLPSQNGGNYNPDMLPLAKRTSSYKMKRSTDERPSQLEDIMEHSISRLVRSKSEDNMKSRSLQAQTKADCNKLYENEAKGEYSDISSGESEAGEDYEGDQSDVDSDIEDLGAGENGRCIIL